MTFREKLRGYHPDDVDQFLERVAEGVAALQSKLDAALARAEKAESERPVDGEDAVQRTLVLAQRTADLALKEAKEEASRLVAEAKATAERLSEQAQKQLRSDLERLEAARKHLNDDVLAMQQYVESERTRVRNALAELVRKLDSSSRKAPAPPAATKLDLPPKNPVIAIPEPVARPATAPEPPIPEAIAPEPAEPVAEPVEAAELVAAEPEPAPRREPQPPPVSGMTFGAARVAGRPTGPPPGPRRFALAEAADQAAESTDPPGDGETPNKDDEHSGLRRLFGR